MDHNPKKSKAFLITFIAVLVLLLVGYVMYSNSSQIFGTKNSSLSKTFAPLLGGTSSKNTSALNSGSQNAGINGGTTSGTQTPSTTGTTTTPTTTGILNGGSGVDSTSGLATGGNLSTGKFGNTGTFGTTTGGAGSTSLSATITPPFNPIPLPLGGGLTVTPNPTPTPTPPTLGTGTPVSGSICPVDDPLVFTDTEKTTLADLLRQYYLLAPTLKNADDVAALQSDIATNQALLDQVTTLTSQCMTQTSDPSYTGPREIKDNPYYTGTAGTTTPYVSTYDTFEQLFNIW